MKNPTTPDPSNLTRLAGSCTKFLIITQICVLFAPTFIWLWKRWTMSVWHNGHSILIVVVVAVLIWRELKNNIALPVNSNPWGFVILIPALMLHMLDTGIHSQLVSAFAFFLSLPGFSFIFLGTRRTKAIIFPLVILFLTMPIPLAFTETLHLILRYITTDGATWLLRLVGVTVYSVGTTIEITNAKLQVADSCSGFSTLYATVTVAILTAYFCPQTARKFIVLLIAVPLAISINIVRVVILTLLVKWFGIDILKSSAHEISGLLTFVIALPIVFLIGQTPKSSGVTK